MKPNPLQGVRVHIGKRTTLGQAFDATVGQMTPLQEKMEESKRRGREQNWTLPNNRKHKL